MGQKTSLENLVSRVHKIRTDLSTRDAASYLLAKGFNDKEIANMADEEINPKYNEMLASDLIFLGLNGIDATNFSDKEIAYASSIFDPEIHSPEEFIDTLRSQLHHSYTLSDWEDFEDKVINHPILYGIGQGLFATAKLATAAAGIIGGISILDLMTSTAHADGTSVIDPFTYLQSNYAFPDGFFDPAGGAWGDITGADAFDNGTKFGIIYDGGNVSLFEDGASAPYLSFSTGGSTGITEVDPAKYPGQIAVTSNNGIIFFDLEGSPKGYWGVQSSEIKDITYDSENDRIFLSTGDHGNGILQADGSIEYLGSCSTSLEYINLTVNGEGTPITDMLQSDRTFRKIYPNGNISDGFNTNLDQGFGTEGIAYTNNHAYQIIDTGAGFYILAYDALDFQPFLQYGFGDEPIIEDPLPETLPAPVLSETIANMYQAEHGNYESLDSIANGTKLAALFTDGAITVFDSEMLNEEYTLETTINNATGLTEVNPIIIEGAKFAVSDASSVNYVDKNGNILRSISVTSDSPIDEISWDASLNRILVGTADGVYSLNESDGTLNLIKAGDSMSIEAVKTSPEFYNWFTQNSGANLFNEDGTYKDDVAERDTGFGTNIKGTAFTQTNAYTTDGTSIFKYNKLSYQDTIDYCLYCPDIYPDGVVDINDLKTLAEAWLYQGSYIDQDINCDGSVNFKDFVSIGESW